MRPAKPHQVCKTRAEALTRMLQPRAIAVIGASRDVTKVSGRPIKHLLDKGYSGKILPVNAKYTDIAGLRCYPDIASLPDGVDVAIVAIAANAVPDCITALGARSIPVAVVFSAGFGEMGQAGRALEAGLCASAQQAGVLLCGPNCLGFINAFEHVCATFSQYADGETPAGAIGFVTQSGAFGTAVAALARARGLGLGYFINTGNEADVSFSELAALVVEEPRIRVVAGYLEGVGDGAGLVRLAQRCQALGKPLVLTKVGRTDAGVRAAASHTGSLAVEDVVFDAVMRQYGVLRARNEEQMLDMLEALVQTRTCAGFGLGIVTQSGGAGVMMADRAQELGLSVPVPSDPIRQRLNQCLPSFGAIGNPVDVTGQFVARPELLRESVIALLDDPQIHVGIVWLQLMTTHAQTLVQLFADVQARTHKPLFICWVAAPESACLALRAQGLPVYGAGERAVEAAAALARFHTYRRQQRLAPPALPIPAAEGIAMLNGVVPSVQAIAWLRAAGMPMAQVQLVCDADAAVQTWRNFAQAVALKIESPDITHKTEVGGVLLNRNTETAVRQGFATLWENAERHAPTARIEGVLVQPMMAGQVELVIGVKRDAVFGTVVMVGIGGIWVEVLKDVAFRHAPFGVDEALDMLCELRLSVVLDGVRGQAAVDRVAVARLLSDLSRWAAATPRLQELDLNPVLIGSDGPICVDCVMVLRDVDNTDGELLVQ